MPHLRFDYSSALADHADMAAFAEIMRRTLEATEIFALGGIRVRGHAATVEALSDGVGDAMFLDMVLRIGAGRSDAEKEAVCEALYAVARAWLEPRVIDLPFALSLELREIDPAVSRKDWNSMHAAVKLRRG